MTDDTIVPFKRPEQPSTDHMAIATAAVALADKLASQMAPLAQSQQASADFLTVLARDVAEIKAGLSALLQIVLAAAVKAASDQQ